jgi:membrane dipeptidase
MRFPIVDLHCDLLSYLQEAPNANPEINEGVGSNLPTLKEGNVKLQVMAIYSSTMPGSTKLALEQSRIYNSLLTNYESQVQQHSQPVTSSSVLADTKINILAAIENASCFCEETETLADGFEKLEQLINNTERIFYVGLTHHGENRFGGGNATSIGLKKDGETLLDHLNGKKIAIDLSHTSDKLAYELLNYLSLKNLDIPILASHSNFRKVFNHPRNLPDDIAKEIISRKGIIGINFLRAFLNDKNPNALYDHLQYGIEIGGAQALCFGADFFYTASHPDQSRQPFFYPGQDDSTCYQAILTEISTHATRSILEQISHQNALNFIHRIWS